MRITAKTILSKAKGDENIEMEIDIKEKEFFETYDPRKYDPVSVSVDNVVFSVDNRLNANNYRKLNEQKLMVLLIRRKQPPFSEKWSLPGGFVKVNESLSEAAIRALNIKTGLQDIYLEQLYTFGDPKRDPRMRIISCAYMTLIDWNNCKLKELENKENIKWFEVNLLNKENRLVLKSNDIDLSVDIVLKEEQNGKASNTGYTITESKLAFDHASIILEGLLRLQGKIEYSDIAFNLLPDKFTITQLQQVYELILGHELIPAAFRRKISGKIVGLGEYTNEKGHRPPQYYKYKSEEGLT